MQVNSIRIQSLCESHPCKILLAKRNRLRACVCTGNNKRPGFLCKKLLHAKGRKECSEIPAPAKDAGCQQRKRVRIRFFLLPAKKHNRPRRAFQKLPLLPGNPGIPFHLIRRREHHGKGLMLPSLHSAKPLNTFFRIRTAEKLIASHALESKNSPVFQNLHRFLKALFAVNSAFLHSIFRPLPGSFRRKIPQQCASAFYEIHLRSAVMAGDRLRMAPSSLPVFFPAGRTQGIRTHCRIFPVIRKTIEDAPPRTAERAADEPVAKTTILRIPHFSFTIRTDSKVRRKCRKLRKLLRPAVDDPEFSFRHLSGSLCTFIRPVFQHFLFYGNHISAGWHLPLQDVLQLQDSASGPADLQNHNSPAVSHGSGKPKFCGPSCSKRAVPDSLYRPRHCNSYMNSVLRHLSRPRPIRSPKQLPFPLLLSQPLPLLQLPPSPLLPSPQVPSASRFPSRSAPPSTGEQWKPSPFRALYIPASSKDTSPDRPPRSCCTARRRTDESARYNPVSKPISHRKDSRACTCRRGYTWICRSPHARGTAPDTPVPFRDTPPLQASSAYSSIHDRHRQ